MGTEGGGGGGGGDGIEEGEVRELRRRMVELVGDLVAEE